VFRGERGKEYSVSQVNLAMLKICFGTSFSKSKFEIQRSMIYHGLEEVVEKSLLFNSPPYKRLNYPKINDENMQKKKSRSKSGEGMKETTSSSYTTASTRLSYESFDFPVLERTPRSFFMWKKLNKRYVRRFIINNNFQGIDKSPIPSSLVEVWKRMGGTGESISKNDSLHSVDAEYDIEGLLSSEWKDVEEA
jgi:hypothetical protein